MDTQILVKHSDRLGIIISTICGIHCIATPLLFVTRACCTNAPNWWKSLDVLFLLLSFITIYFSIKHSTNSLVKIGLGLSWLFLAAVIANEYINIFSFPEWLIYIPAFCLIILHVYNRKYCQCKYQCCNN